MLASTRPLSRGILLSSLLTGLLVSLVLFVHLRSKRALILLGLNILIATIIAFGAAALTVVCADEPAIMRMLIRAMRDHLPGVRVFFRREYARDRRPARARTVLNVTGPVGRGGR